MNASIVKENAAYNYNPLVDYSQDPLCSIGTMCTVCTYCEGKGMCCSSGKNKFLPLTDPPSLCIICLLVNRIKSFSI